MKHLRKTIRKLILENEQHYEKLLLLLSSDYVEDVKQGIDLAETLGYAEVVEYQLSPAAMIHYWKLEVQESLWNYWAQSEMRGRAEFDRAGQAGPYWVELNIWEQSR